MANKNLELALRIRADLKQAVAQVDQLEKALSGTGTAGRRASTGINNASNSTATLRNEIATLPVLLRNVAALMGVAFSVKEIAAAAEVYTTIQNRLALVTKNSDELANAQDAVFQAAQSARQPLSATAELYQRIATNADALKLSGAGVAGVVDTINKTLAISGTSGASSAAALTQLGQAFASGTLRGEELNSVLEQAPALAKTLADGLGVTVGQLRQLGQDGKLTAQNVIQALQSQAGAVNEQFSKITVTGTQALTVLGNSITKVVGELNQAAGASTAFGNVILELSAYLDSGQLTDGLITSLSIWSSVFSAIGSDIESLGTDLDGVSYAGGETVKFLIQAFKQMPANLRSAVQIAAVEILALFDKTIAYAGYVADNLKAVFTSSTQDEALAAVEKRFAEINAVRQQSIEGILKERDAILENAEAEKQRREQELKSREDARVQREKEIAALNDKAKNQKVNFGVDPQVQKAAEKYVKQLELQAAMIGATSEKVHDLENAEKQLTGTLLERARAAQKVIDADKERSQIANLQIELLRSQGKDQDALQLEFKEKYGKFLTSLSEENRAKGKALVEGLFNAEQLSVQLKTAEKEIDKTLRALSAQENSINIQREAGLISEYDARSRILDLHRQTYAELDKQRPLLAELAKQPGVVGEAAAQALEKLNGQQERLQATTSLFQSTLKQGLESGLTDAIMGLEDGTKSFGDAVKSLGQSVAQALAQMAAQAIASNIVGALFPGGGGGLGSLLSGFATGGQVIGPGTGTSDSIPAMLSNNEFVTRAAIVQQPSALNFLHDFNARGMAALQDWAHVRHATGGLAGVPAPAMPSPTLSAELTSPTSDSGGVGQRGMRIINVVDKELVRDWAESAGGEQVLVNIIRKNGQALWGSRS